MNNYFAFLKKEFVENLRTKRLLVLSCVFLFFAITTPFLTRFMGEFLGLLLPGDDAATDALIGAMSNTTWIDSYIQYYSQVAQIGIFAILFMFMSIVSRELSTGTASLLFSKGLGFWSFLMAKFSMATILTTLVSIVSAFVAFAYTVLLFDEGGSIGDVFLGAIAFSIGVQMILAIILFCSSHTKSSGVAGGMSVGIYFLMILTNIIPNIGRFSPMQLFSHPVTISVGEASAIEGLWVNIILAFAVTAVALFFAARGLSKAEG